MSREGSAQTVFPLSCDAVSSHLSDQQLTSRRELTMLNQPESLLKLQRHSDRFCVGALTFSTKEQKRNCKSLRILLGPNHNPCTASINRLNTAVRAVLKQPCLTGGQTGTVRPKQEPTGWTDLSDRSRLVLCDRSQELIGQACPTRRQVLRSDSACPTTGQTRLFEHRSNCRV
ncbi:hypothetical protein PCANC_05141 [Puccinia coronata f. sp. avenae]|uniref:Uncharacterized protein n=1 Tax=Puccinia coronata f. sp. avenae TaxID=200324 RepID=A0A2N5W355_9BASI|nr:hypothetical protein PCANC_05141 [Puccinia coronata f. sp. avenae]